MADKSAGRSRKGLELRLIIRILYRGIKVFHCFPFRFHGEGPGFALYLKPDRGTMLVVEPKDSEKLELVERILASGLFRKSPRLSGFLRFIYDEQSAGRENTINEQLIGTEVFGRRAGYHVGEDSIVRSQARFLRQRLEQYFATEGRNETLVLTIPKGSYIPAFVLRQDAEGEIASAMAPPDANEFEPAVGVGMVADYSSTFPRSAPHPWWGSKLFAGFAVIAVLLLAMTSVVLLRERKHPVEADDALIRAFWTSIFAPNRSVLFIPADSSLVTWERIGGKTVPLRSYMSKAYIQSPPDGSGVWERLANSGYTSIADLNLVAQLDRIPEVGGSRFQIRYAGDLSLSELKAANAILSGGPMANPWVELYEPKMRLALEYNSGTRHSYVRDRQGGQKADTLYMETTEGGPEGSQAYGVIGYLPSLDGQGHNLLLEGTSQAGTDAAAAFLRGNDFARFLHELGATPADIPNFEILISAKSLAGGVYSQSVVTWHKLPGS